MKEYRCLYCNKLLLRGKFIGNIEIMCNRCKHIVKIECQEKEEHQSV